MPQSISWRSRLSPAQLAPRGGWPCVSSWRIGAAASATVVVRKDATAPGEPLVFRFAGCARIGGAHLDGGEVHIGHDSLQQMGLEDVHPGVDPATQQRLLLELADAPAAGKADAPGLALLAARLVHHHRRGPVDVVERQPRIRQRLLPIGPLVGALLGSVISDPSVWGLDAAAAAAFLGLVWPRLKHLQSNLTALVAVIFTLVLVPLIPSGIPVIVGAPLAVGLIYLLKRTGLGKYLQGDNHG